MTKNKLLMIVNQLLGCLINMPVGNETTVGIMLENAGYGDIDDIAAMDVMDLLKEKAKEVGINMDYSVNGTDLIGLPQCLSFIKKEL